MPLGDAEGGLGLVPDGAAAVNAGKSVDTVSLTLFWSRVKVPPGYLS